ncbi:hypothetical protein CDD82_4968 [Ophiocordyceps australis]|uniref:Uncharacterized protein n=1 Tax=Ophiocordyceps australis TaxID=1399860 RepID=A0A2C5Z592_9HYPO|nr:hypothetical protein CDD82_4968 [Ophiocordyceps australis]
MAAFRNLIDKIPDWQRRLDDLGGQIKCRQAELAVFNAQSPASVRSRSLRNKGSAESLAPKDDTPWPMDLDKTDKTDQIPNDKEAPQTRPTTSAQAIPSSPESANRLALHKKAREAVAAAHPRALTHANKKRRSSSMISAEGAPPTYRTRNMIIVYYDSYVQGFFDELVRFISSSRNLLRKARMAAKVARIKRMAEQEIMEDHGGDQGLSGDALPSLRYMSTRRLGRLGDTNGDGQAPDVHESLDRSLEFVQSTCEHGAHQFLRDADCDEEIKKIQSRLAEVLTTAAAELERVQRQDPELASESMDMVKARARRPISVRRGLTLGQRGEGGSDKEPLASPKAMEPDPEKNGVLEASSPLGVDATQDADEGIDVMLPKLNYRSTRYMRNGAA